MTDTSTKDFYQILGVEKTATENQIKNAYRKLAIKYHPDKNPSDTVAAEKFKEISIAYAVLSDPSRRRQYDLSGPSGSVIDFEGIDVDQMSGVARVFGALFTSLGVPIPTQITPKILNMAKEIECGQSTDSARKLEFGNVCNGRIERQDGQFYTFQVSEQDSNQGVIISCRSTSMSKFKLILFDREGCVRSIEESQKDSKCTLAEMFFVPFDHMRLMQMLPLKLYYDDKDVPPHFHLLDGYESSMNLKLQPGQHLICVYGDNWLQAVKYSIVVLNADTTPGSPGSLAASEITDCEKELSDLKRDLSTLQPEFVEAKQKYESAVEKLDTNTKKVKELLKKRKEAYERFVKSSERRLSSQIDTTAADSGFGIFRSFFGNK